MYNTAGVLSLATAGVQRVSIDANGALIIAAPTAGSAATITGLAGQSVATFNGPSDNQVNINALTGGRYSTLNFNNNALVKVSMFWDNTISAFLFNLPGAGVIPQIDSTGNLNVNNGNSSVSPVYAGIPQNAQSSNYTFVLADANKHLYAATGTSTYTIPANASVPFPIGTAITIANGFGGNLTLAINTDTLGWFKGGAIPGGTRTIATGSVATILKVTSTIWALTGNGIS